jgi:membrane protein implicated in regulation of membrane protease activity
VALVAGFAVFVFVGGPVGVAALVAGALMEVGELYLWTRYLGRIRVRTGVEGLVGEKGWVIAECGPLGKVRVRGEIWQALSEGERVLGEGTEIEVTAVEGLRVTVRELAAG